MVRLIHELQKMWDNLRADTISASDTRPTIRRYFLSGVNQSALWLGTYKEGDERMMMREWAQNPFTKKFEWAKSKNATWAEDRVFGTREINVFEAEHKFPGCTKGRTVK